MRRLSRVASEAMTDAQRYRSFMEFWPLYVREHSLAVTRRWHFVGTLAALAVLGWALVVDLRGLWAVPVAGYGFAWYSHFFVERNRPATFTYPLWSLLGDFRMFWLMLTGRMDAEVERYVDRVAPPSGANQGS